LKPFASRDLAPFAVDQASSRGRLVSEPASATRSPWQRDRDRIIHSTAFRRLKDKTQVFITDEGDHYRTRLTHTIEVSQIARALARSLRLDEDLAETLALAHDLGHPPFGHSGEDALDRAMAPWGGFDHNAQSLRVVTRLERRYALFDGLNLTWESLEGLVKHNGPLTSANGEALSGTLPHALKAYGEKQDLWLWSWPSLEAQAAALADDIAYDAHDVDDGVRSGLIALDDLKGLALFGDLLSEIDQLYPGLSSTRRTYEFQRRLITSMVEDVITETSARLADQAPLSCDDVRRAGRALVGFSPRMREAERALKTQLYAKVYRAPSVMAIRARTEAALERLFRRYMEAPEILPEDWHERLVGEDETRSARHICDFIAGMTDGFALKEYQRVFDAPAELR
jgi:dGTPase